MRKPASFFLGVLLLLDTMAAQAAAESQKTKAEPPKTVIIDIPSDLPPSLSDEAIVPLHPFFDETTGNEVFEEVEELKARVDKLQARVEKLENKTPALEKKAP
ncbi:MAG: hypothetical protein K2W92_10235 [Alphaproteobacteria bacterium]|nr:hypothetical protein [Alphaproteobacteria bacterium]